MTFVMSSIGTVRSTRTDVVDDDWDRESVYVELDPRFGPDALAGLDTFSHVEVLFFMDRVEPAKIETGARHPRNNRDWPSVGIFAQRGKNRPNQIGATVCRVLRVEGARVYLEGLDAVDGTPVLDLKPWVREFGPRGEVRQPAWMDALMGGYWK
jgi:tRNA-Thr(GGU) m(6)t(6)A37 methyltransferase TsaA